MQSIEEFVIHPLAGFDKLLDEIPEPAFAERCACGGDPGGGALALFRFGLEEEAGGRMIDAKRLVASHNLAAPLSGAIGAHALRLSLSPWRGEGRAVQARKAGYGTTAQGASTVA
jgi:hypothetical protein